ncbi:MAG TPA: response regulator [Bryobacteraceae bacterium]|nr:response regulator [Bryobacteraceae bacterium]
MKKLRTLVVDDERICRHGLLRLLRIDPEVEIAGECANGLDAVAAIRENRPDLVFLDIQMPEMDGFAVLRSLAPDETPRVIFVTAYDQYAIRAFEINALDYLLKPFSDERFANALARAKNIPARPLDNLLEQTPSPARFVVRSGGRARFIAVEDVDWIESAQNYVCLHAGEDSGLLRETMASLEERLRPAQFVRIHRALLVNACRVREINSIGEGEYELLVGGRLLKSSRGYRRAVTNLIRLGSLPPHL